MPQAGALTNLQQLVLLTRDDDYAYAESPWEMLLSLTGAGPPPITLLVHA